MSDRLSRAVTPDESRGLLDTSVVIDIDVIVSTAWQRSKDALAQYNLGGMYATGGGVPQDYQEAVRWYRLAAEQGEGG